MITQLKIAQLWNGTEFIFKTLFPVAYVSLYLITI